MRQNYCESEVQRWALVDLSPWHESLVRQQLRLGIDFLSSESANEIASPQSRSLQTIVTSILTRGASPGPSERHALLALEPFDILIVDGNSENLFSEHSDAPNSIRLVWDWGPSKLSSYRTAQQCKFNGVIRDHQSLRSWVRICKERGNRSTAESHPILSKTPIPSLIQQSPIAVHSNRISQADRKSK